MKVDRKELSNTPRRDFLRMAGAGTAIGLYGPSSKATAAPAVDRTLPCFDVRLFGATGDGRTIDSAAINKAIEAAQANGGGTVHIGAGHYLCYSIRLRSQVALYLDPGAILIAADPLPEGQAGGYDDPEPDPEWKDFQDYGHAHWRNSLIWGEGLRDIAIYGPGRVWGRGLSHGNGPSEGTQNLRVNGIGNKAIALKNCCNVILDGFEILEGGWFGVLATGVDNLTIHSLRIDTNRDGMDIDCCRNVRITNCSVNSPWDDAIVLKSSYALGRKQATENVTISECFVTGGYEVGSMLSGQWTKFKPEFTVWRTGRIKLGTESNGSFSNIVISNCVFEDCQGLALETVDGATLENVTISNIVMRDIISSPLFLRLGSRLRGPLGTAPGTLRRILISNIVCTGAESEHGCIITGLPGHAIEDVKLSAIFIEHRGGGTVAQARIIPAENAEKYPEPNMFGPMPSQGFFLRHVHNIELSGIEIVPLHADTRPAFVLDDVHEADFFQIKTPSSAPVIDLRNGTGIRTLWVRGVSDGALGSQS